MRTNISTLKRTLGSETFRDVYYSCLYIPFIHIYIGPRDAVGPVDDSLVSVFALPMQWSLS